MIRLLVFNAVFRRKDRILPEKRVYCSSAAFPYRIFAGLVPELFSAAECRRKEMPESTHRGACVARNNNVVLKSLKAVVKVKQTNIDGFVFIEAFYQLCAVPAYICPVKYHIRSKGGQHRCTGAGFSARKLSSISEYSSGLRNSFRRKLFEAIIIPYKYMFFISEPPEFSHIFLKHPRQSCGQRFLCRA